MRLLNLPTLRCPLCLDDYTLKIEHEKASITYKHLTNAEIGLPDHLDCLKAGSSITKSFADFSIDL